MIGCKTLLPWAAGLLEQASLALDSVRQSCGEGRKLSTIPAGAEPRRGNEIDRICGGGESFILPKNRCTTASFFVLDGRGRASM
jgi:hypothetical protein